MIKVLVVEDSPVVREFLLHILASDPEIEVVGTASDGEAAVDAVSQKKPDAITMDIHMPKMDGIEATRRIMETRPTPIVIVSGSSTADEVTLAFRAMEAGALAVAQRPWGLGHPDHEGSAKELVQTVKLMAEVKVVRRWPRRPPPAARPAVSALTELELKRVPAEITLVALGASTGGPLVLQRILSGLPKDFPIPVVVVQHMAPGFVQGFAEWLSQSTGFPVQVAAHGDLLQPGRCYVAPDGFHLNVEAGGRIALSQQEAENGLRPSVSCLFRSVARVYGEKAVGILLTGMGKDGAEELKRLKEMGGLTIVQDEKSSVVYGMPGEAARLEAATYILPPEKIAAALANLANRKSQEDRQGD